MKTSPHPSGKEGTIKWVSTEWLERYLTSGSFMLVDSQPDIHDYLSEHIEGAVYFNNKHFRVPNKGWPGTYVPEDVMRILLGCIGLSPEVPVVVYTGKGVFRGWGDGLEQTMTAYSIARFGHRHVYILNGGLDRWKEEERSLTQDFPRIEETTFPINLRTDFFVSYEDVKSMVGRPDVQLIDVRPPEVYQGQSVWKKPGHIPGALNLPWPSLMDDDNPTLLKPDKEIANIVSSRGIDPAKTLVVYCGTGREATNPFCLLKWYLGYPNVKIYEGSFTDWASRPETKTVTGSEPTRATPLEVVR